jgi:hypothetical protein
LLERICAERAGLVCRQPLKQSLRHWTIYFVAQQERGLALQQRASNEVVEREDPWNIVFRHRFDFMQRCFEYWYMCSLFQTRYADSALLKHGFKALKALRARLMVK